MITLGKALWALTLGLTFTLSAAGAPARDNILQQASEALKAGNPSNALAMVQRVIAAQPTNAAAWFIRGLAYERLGHHTNSIVSFDQAIRHEPKALAYQHRGAAHFRVGNFEKSVADFDTFIKLVPSQAPAHWQRGISLYYAGKFAEGAKQFQSHQTVNPHDVENAAWHFLCVARADGLEKAKASLISVTNDARVPMKEIHALFAGQGKAEDVLAAAEKAGGEHPPFFAHLYLGLYYEAMGEASKTREHIFKAARDFKADHYMGDVARVHARLLERAK